MGLLSGVGLLWHPCGTLVAPVTPFRRGCQPFIQRRCGSLTPSNWKILCSDDLEGFLCFVFDLNKKLTLKKEKESSFFSLNRFFALSLPKNRVMNKIVLITGATSGIGLGCAKKFAENGDKLILTGRNEQRLAEIERELTEKGAQVLTLAFDVRDREKAMEKVAGLPEEWREIDVLVNNAGLALGLEPEYEGDLDDWETMIDTNIKGLLLMTKLVVPGMVERGRGHIINVGSVAGDAAYAGGNVYCATKAAVKALTDGLRIDVADTPIRVTNLKPGLVETNFSNIRFHGDTDRAAKLYTGIKPLTGDDIANVAVFAANAPAHVQIAEVLILATHQASGSVIVRK